MVAMNMDKIKIFAGIITAGLAVQAAVNFLIAGDAPAVLPAFACIAAVAAAGEYKSALIAGFTAGVLFIPFAGTTASAVAGLVASPAGAASALAVYSEMNKKGEESFSPVFSVFSGSMIAGMFVMAAGLSGITLPGPGAMFAAFSALLLISLLAGVICQGVLIILKKNNPGIRER